MPVIETGYLTSVTKHDDGRVTMTRAVPGASALFLHIQFTERELDALRTILDSGAKPC